MDRSFSQLSGRIVASFSPAKLRHTITATFFSKAVALVLGQQFSVTVLPAIVCVPAQATRVHSLNFA